jgi:hypothetical protein
MELIEPAKEPASLVPVADVASFPLVELETQNVLAEHQTVGSHVLAPAHARQ